MWCLLLLLAAGVSPLYDLPDDSELVVQVVCPHLPDLHAAPAAVRVHVTGRTHACSKDQQPRPLSPHDSPPLLLLLTWDHEAAPGLSPLALPTPIQYSRASEHLQALRPPGDDQPPGGVRIQRVSVVAPPSLPPCCCWGAHLPIAHPTDEGDTPYLRHVKTKKNSDFSVLFSNASASTTRGSSSPIKGQQEGVTPAKKGFSPRPPQQLQTGLLPLPDQPSPE